MSTGTPEIFTRSDIYMIVGYLSAERPSLHREFAGDLIAAVDLAIETIRDGQKNMEDIQNGTVSLD